jgi:DNA-binding transcriptional MerR regulator
LTSSDATNLSASYKLAYKSEFPNTSTSTRLDPLDNSDYYSKSIAIKYIFLTSAPTFNKWEKEGIVFPPRHKKTASVNARTYYSLADLMRLSIIHYGSIHMDKIYNCIVVQHYGEQNLNVNKSALLTGKTALSAVLRNLISQSFKIVKYQIVNEIKLPVDLAPYLKPEQ